MRMWLVDTRIMCRQHLLGEYREHFTIIGTIAKGISIKGYIENDLIEPRSIFRRYKELKKEMLLRGYKPIAKFRYDRLLIKKLLPKDHYNHKINKQNSYDELLRRCPQCCKLSKELK